MITLIVCGILEHEVRKVVQHLAIPVNMVVMPPQLHKYPLRLKQELETQLRISDTKKVVYGKCFPGIDDFLKKYNAQRIEGETCYEIVAGDTFYELLRKEPGTYFMLPQLCEAFDELTDDIRLKELKNIYFKNYKQCILLDTGIPYKKCTEVSEELGLPYHIISVGIGHLEKRVKDLLQRGQ
ncbi:MAG: DUF1638 domain-containing protein [Theionarchaea archaeon]|nr:DUF1638 domain-containing protein [Theionarchaea archaeon]